ncbi:MAG: hypothetical protein JRI25_29315 [Deltaproteobacteria bacterium]|nr:hypothetical protein [Deltaproteobacteria bacterium]
MRFDSGASRWDLAWSTLILVLLVLPLAAGLEACGTVWDQEPHGDAFMLRGRHVDLVCEDCHTPGSGDLPTACAGCHEADRPVPHDPDDCGECHTEEGWGTVDHGFFPLVNAHDLECVQCHTDGGYTGLDALCVACHESERPTGHFIGEECGGCHSPTAWEDAHVDHSFFPLQVGHDLDCRACHDGADFSGLSSECTACHESDRPVDHYEDAACVLCHEPTLWDDPTYDHAPLPIEDAHALACAECHTGSDFTAWTRTASAATR